ncbi:hypothetical protein MIMGU_mgv1a001942mg [Erythranthe guttata]|uniref:Subtilisin-like protease fibronectin type-III domain-containing protein n=1 Tax=Erythranthe guttata TaxID=4155 RepID=A0A022RYF1_ERYGU|nr:hypothetical protein MIMGU_mgv1a001942mg [Erythranthe guttata]
MDYIHFLMLFSCLMLVYSNLGQCERSTYIVHMDKEAMPMIFPSHGHWYSSTISSIKSTHVQQPPEIIYTYDNVVHGFSAQLSEDELHSLENSPGFLTAYIDRNLTLDTTHTYKFLSLNHVTGLWPTSNYGEDIIVGVIDSGVWPESPSFKDHGMPEIPKRWKGTCQEGPNFNSSLCNRKLIGVQYFDKGAKAANLDLNTDNNSGRDTKGHGTHTSSTVAGNYVEGASFFGYAPGTARGVAPRASVAMYKVEAGMDRAVADGVDVISISMGFDQYPLYEDPIAVASFGAFEKGVFVSTSAGNDGGTATLHNGIPWALTVAAGSVDRFFAGTLTLGNGATILGWSMFPASALLDNLPLIYNKTLSSCNSSDALSGVGHAIIICEDESSFYRTDVISNVAAAIFISDNPELQLSSHFPSPGVLISRKDGSVLIEYATKVARLPPSATIKLQQTLVGTKGSPVVALYSSRGPARACPYILKPDVMAPGTLVLASWMPNKPTASIGGTIILSSEFNAISGTSMACPHASGIAALLKSAHPEWSPSAIKSAIMTTANPLDNTRKPIRDSLLNFEAATPLAMGSGHIDPNRALDPGLIYNVTRHDYVNLVCSMNFTREQTKSILRSSYDCSTPSSDLNYPAFIAIYKQNREGTVMTRVFKRRVTNVWDGPSSYRVELQLPKYTKVTVRPTTLVFNKKYEELSYQLTVSYSGGNGSLPAHGSITWTEEAGRKHSVRSPIVIYAL